MQKSELAKIGKKATFGDDIKLTPKEFKKLKRLARIGIEVQNENEELQDELQKVKSNYNQLQHAYNGLKTRFNTIWKELSELRDSTKRYLDALKHAPNRVKTLISEVLEQHKNRKLERGNDYSR